MTRSRSAQQRKVHKAKPGKMGSASMGGTWATLPPPVTSATIKLLDPGLIGGFASVARRAGLQFRDSTSMAPRLRGGKTFPPFFRLVSLQTANGDFVPDAQERIDDGGAPLGFGQAIATQGNGQQIHATPWGETTLKILENPDTVSVLRELQ